VIDAVTPSVTQYLSGVFSTSASTMELICSVEIVQIAPAPEAGFIPSMPGVV